MIQIFYIIVILKLKYGNIEIWFIRQSACAIYIRRGERRVISNAIYFTRFDWLCSLRAREGTLCENSRQFIYINIRSDLDA